MVDHAATLQRTTEAIEEACRREWRWLHLARRQRQCYANPPVLRSGWDVEARAATRTLRALLAIRRQAVRP